MKDLNNEELLEKEKEDKKRRDQNAKRNIIILLVVAIFAILYIVFNKQVTDLRLSNFGIETNGIILDIDSHLFADPESGYSGGASLFKTIRYEFHVEGKRYKGISINPDHENIAYIPMRSLVVGDSVTVRYLKYNPRINKLDYGIVYNIEF